MIFITCDGYFYYVFMYIYFFYKNTQVYENSMDFRWRFRMSVSLEFKSIQIYCFEEKLFFHITSAYMVLFPQIILFSSSKIHPVKRYLQTLIWSSILFIWKVINKNIFVSFVIKNIMKALRLRCRCSYKIENNALQFHYITKKNRKVGLKMLRF